jgi:tRNA pseudouridine38-40 synthase
MQNYKLIISYDGTDYHGWQRQPKKLTIQGLLEEKLSKITQKKITVIGAGRTDAGVHAQGQVANFKANISLSEEELLRALNSVLPGEIKVVSLEKVDLNFHARKMAKSKIYQYRIFNSPNIPPFLHRYALYRPSPLNIKMMQKAALLFEREADFTAFSSNRLLNPARKVTTSRIEKKGKEIIYTIEANGFLRYMVRTIVGTLLEVGKGKLSPVNIEEIFKEQKRSLAGPTAPAKGLCLIKVIY